MAADGADRHRQADGLGGPRRFVRSVAGAAVPDVLKVLFEREDDARRRRARDFAVHVAGIIEVAIQERMDPGTLESARLAASNALRAHGLTDGQVVALDLDPNRAARAVMEKVTFSADERAEIAPLAERALVTFYTGVTTSQTVFPEFMPAIQTELLHRSAQQGEMLVRLRELLERPRAGWVEELRRVLGPSVPNLELIEDDKLPAVVRKLLEDLGTRPELAPEASQNVRALLAEVEEKLKRLEFGAAASRLDQVLAERQEERERRAIDDAALLEERARVSALQLRYREAADFLGHTAALLDFDPARRWRLTALRGDSLYALGHEFGDKAALREAVSVYREALTLAPRERVPLDWAATQNNLGNALKTLGERGDDAALREAAATYRAALEERTRERVPLDWATTQNNLGNALLTLGERGDEGALREAVAAYRAALEELTRERVPLHWSTTQNNLGTVLKTLGERGDDAALLRDAVAAFRAALEERTRERVPFEWAATQNNLGGVFLTLGERGDDAALREAITAFRAALEEWTRIRVPLPWALAQENLAGALRAQATRARDCALVAEAMAAINGAIEEFARRDAPYNLDKARRNRELLATTARDLGCP